MEEIKITEEQRERIRKIQLEMLREVHRICEENHIKYVLGYGTMLGAVRHKGFIPWDDDVDILMLRKDYRRFREACKKELPPKYFLQDECSDEYYLWGYSKLRNLNTTYVRCGQEHIPYKNGVFIDIFPLDNVPWFLPFRILPDAYGFVLRKMLWAKVGKNTEKNPLVRLVYKILAPIPKSTIYKLRNVMVHKGNKVSDRVRCLLFTAPGKEENKKVNSLYSRYGFKRDWLLDREKYVFEGEEFWGTRAYDDCLSYVYGDYMKLPPEEKRVGHAPVSKLELNQEGL